jgi:hypothetical protein
MAKLTARGPGPVNFTADDGTQHFFPLSWVFFDGGAVKLEPPAGSPAIDPALSAAVEGWLAVLASEGIVQSAPPPGPTGTPVTPPPAPTPAAMVISAAQPGALGNDIAITIQNVRDTLTQPSATVFDALVVQSETIAGLTPASVAATLGSAAGEGLVFVSSAGNPTPPLPGDYQFTAGANPADPATADIPDAANPAAPAFTLSTRGGGPEALNTAVTIADDASIADGFSLTATWSKAADGIEPDDFGPSFDYVVTVTPPPAVGGAAPVIGIPAEGQYVLAGGTGSAGAAAAQAQLPGAS